MSDPLGVAGSAVGIVSLGLQVSHGLINYFSAVKGRKEEIEDGIQEVQRVVSLLYSLNHVLPEVKAGRCTQSLQDSLDSCYTKLEKLQQFLDVLNSFSRSADTPGTLRKTTRSLIYPFQQAKLNVLHDSLRKDLGNLRLAIEIVTLELNITIRQEVELISQEAITNSTYQNGQLETLRVQVQQNSNEIQSLKSTISGALEVIRDQLHHTRWIIRDRDQRVDGRLTWIETGLSSIAHDSAVTTANIEKITQTLSSHSESLANMGMQLSQVHADTHTGAIAEDHDTDPVTLANLVSRDPRSTRSRSPTCTCASTLPTSRTSFKLWHLKFELEVQEQHQRSCELFGIHKSKKRKLFAQFPLKVAWFSARMAFACLEYTSGTSSPGYSVRYKNVVHADRSPVIQLFHEMWHWDIESRTGTQIVRDLEAIQRQVISMYRDGTASAYDRDERDWTHAEIFFLSIINAADCCSLLDKMVEDNRVLWAVLRVFESLLQINHDSDGILFASIVKTYGAWQDLNLTKTETQNAHDFLRYVAKLACFNPSHIDIMLGPPPSDCMCAFVRAAEDLSPLHKAIILQSLDGLIDCICRSPSSIMESMALTGVDSHVKWYTVLHLVCDWPEGLRYLLSTEAKSLLENNKSPDEFSTPVVEACYNGNFECVNILMEAGCCLELSRRASYWFVPPECTEAIASNLAKRRLQLLKLVQAKLGQFVQGTTVAFADLAAARICKSLDKANIPIPQTLRVEKDYKSIYSCTSIPYHSLHIFWAIGFRHGNFHDNLGLQPAMTYRVSMDRPRSCIRSLYFPEAYSRLRDLGFLDATPADPLKLGLNLSSTGYHYIGAIFGSFSDTEPRHTCDSPSLHVWYLIEELSSLQVQDDCQCWCNVTTHGCSPIKLLLKSHLDERHPGMATNFDILRHIILHHAILDSSSSSPRRFVIEILRLLTFEALDMTHTCCTFEPISEDIVRDMVSTASQKPAAIFSCRAEKVRRIRSCAEEVASARLLEDLMSEFTSQLMEQPPCPSGFDHFVQGYWRQRMARVYDPDPEVMREMEQHQAFRGFNASSGVKKNVLPKRVLRLIGDDFQLAGHENSEDDRSLSSWSESLSEIDQLSDNESLSDTESVSDFKPLFCQYCLTNDSSSDDESIDYESGDDESSAGESVEGSSSGL